MEEDMKVLEKYVERDIPCNSCKYCAERPKVAGALRNLIKGYKELEEMLKNRIKYTNELEKDLFENTSNYVIPKSKVREKIEEYKNMRDKKFDYMSIMYNKLDLVVQVLQELLEERN